MSRTPFDNLERLAATVASGEHTSAVTSLLTTRAVEEENMRRETRMRQQHLTAMSAFARAELALGKLHAGGRFNR